VFSVRSVPRCYSHERVQCRKVKSLELESAGRQPGSYAAEAMSQLWDISQGAMA
jgi:hypothetical protein